MRLVAPLLNFTVDDGVALRGSVISGWFLGFAGYMRGMLVVDNIGVCFASILSASGL